ncbi:unnamed protein product [Ranitomeya imitator]|uniref:Protein HID1 n=1 Tax=Ranitomeya imitator TaxID=111125 RepID=A0ABN9MMG9_9NEOB|nr:unnamed protein product [Ranitomeya imitator]
MERNCWSVLKHPAMSPDLNPIEHLGRDLKIYVERRHRSNMRDLGQFAKKECSKIPVEMNAKSVQSSHQSKRIVMPVEATDDAFWDQFWSDSATSVQDVFALIPAAEIRAVREESPSNLATLCYKAVEKLVAGADSGCHSDNEKQMVLNCARLLTRVLPYIFEDPDWRGFFWSSVPGAGRNQDEDDEEDGSRPLAESLLLAIADLLFCPDFTVQSHKKSGADTSEDIHTLDSCEYIWEAGVGFAHSPAPNHTHDLNRTELLKLLLTCFSEAMYLPPSSETSGTTNPWVQFFCSTENRYANENKIVRIVQSSQETAQLRVKRISALLSVRGLVNSETFVKLDKSMLIPFASRT